MAANPFTIVKNDPAATRMTGVARHEMQEDAGGTDNGETKAYLDDRGLVVIIGRGVTDKNITYIARFNTNGVLCYSYPNAAGTGLITTPTQP